MTPRRKSRSKRPRSNQPQDPHPIHLSVNDRELATILAALKYHQDENLQGITDIPDKVIKRIATRSGTIQALNFDEITHLSQRLKASARTRPPAHSHTCGRSIDRSYGPLPPEDPKVHPAKSHEWYIPSLRLTLYQPGRKDYLLVLDRDHQRIWELPFAQVEVSDKYDNQMHFLDRRGVVIAEFTHNPEPQAERPAYVLQERPHYPYSIFWAVDELLGAEVWAWLETLHTHNKKEDKS